MTGAPWGELEQIEREEREARERLEAAREQHRLVDGEAPAPEHELIRKLEADWEHARERLHRARGSAGEPRS